MTNLVLYLQKGMIVLRFIQKSTGSLTTIFRMFPNQLFLNYVLEINSFIQFQKSIILFKFFEKTINLLTIFLKVKALLTHCLKNQPIF